MFNFGSPFAIQDPRLGGQAQPQQVQRQMISPFDHMQQMMQNPFGAMGGGMFGRDMFGDMFSHMNTMARQMSNPDMLQSQLQTQNPNAPVFAQSSVYSYTSNGQGAPRVYQEHSSLRQGPGGVRETRRAVRDSAQQREQMSIGHHIGERAHIIERSRHTATGDQEENQELINLDEEQAEQFDQEFRSHMQQGATRADRRMRVEGRRHSPYGQAPRAIEYHATGQQGHARPTETTGHARPPHRQGATSQPRPPALQPRPSIHQHTTSARESSASRDSLNSTHQAKRGQH